MTTNEMKNVITAYEEGKIIREIDARGDVRNVFTKDKYVDFQFNFGAYSYEIAETKKYRGCRDLEELKRVWLEKTHTTMPSNDCVAPFIWVKRDDGLCFLIDSFNFTENLVYIGTWITLAQLLDKFTFLDGTPCGVEC